MSTTPDDDNSGLGGFKRPAPEKYEPVAPAKVTVPDFNPFAALGLDPATATRNNVRPAFLRSLRHRTPQAIAAHPATANEFPSQLQIMQASDYLGGEYHFAIAITSWSHRHSRRFEPTLAIGDRNVFAATAVAGYFDAAPDAAASTSAAAADFHTPTTSRSTPYFGSGSGSRYAPSTANATSTAGNRPSKSRRTSATGPGSSPATGGSAEDPFALSDDEDDEDDEATAPSTPTPRNRPAHKMPAAAAASPSASYAAVAAAGNSATSAAFASGATASGPSGAVAAATPVAAAPPRRRARRSGGNSFRASPIANPVTDQRIVVGTWARATAAPPNAVVAGFTGSGQLFFRITRFTTANAPVAGPTSTAVGTGDINLRPPYAGLDAIALRALIDTHLRLPTNLRP